PRKERDHREAIGVRLGVGVIGVGQLVVRRHGAVSVAAFLAPRASSARRTAEQTRDFAASTGPAWRGAMTEPLSPELLRRMNAYWRAANYLSVGQIYLLANPRLREPLRLEHVKPRLLGHWGTTPGLNFVYVHMNRVIKERDLDAIYVTGPGHGGPGIVANTWLEGTYSEVYPNVPQDEAGMQALFRQFSFPGGI